MKTSKRPLPRTAAQERAWSLFVIEGAIKNMSGLELSQNQKLLRSTAVARLKAICSDIRGDQS